MSEVDVVPLEEPPLDELPPEDEPPDTTPEPEPVLSIEPLGNVKVAPFVEKTTLPFLSVRYTEVPAEESLLKASDVGCP